MSNAKQEFIEVTKRYKVVASSISRDGSYGGDYEGNTSAILLKTEYTKEEYDKFLDSLDFEYDSGYGGQELYGTIWCEDGVWMERGEYDGSEWWDTHQYPDIFDELRNLGREREREINKVLN